MKWVPIACQIPTLSAAADGACNVRATPRRTIHSHSKSKLSLGRLFLSRRFGLFLLAPVVFALEFFDSTGRVDEFLLTRKERVRRRTDIDRYQRHRATFKLAGLLRLDRRANQELNSRGRILEHNFSILGMNALFHDPTALQGARRRMLARALAAYLSAK